MPFASCRERTEDLFNGRNSKVARRTLPRELWKRALNRLSLLDYAADLSDVGNVPGNRLEALKGDRKGQHSIRINEQYRICFRWTDVGHRHIQASCSARSSWSR